jgi:hypothetical protein
MRKIVTVLALAVSAALAGTPAAAQTFNSGSTGADGPFSPTTSVTLTVPPTGVFNFTTINIPVNVTVSFTTQRGVRTPPVMMLATGNVVIAGTIDLRGANQGGGGNGGSGTQLFGNGGVGGPGAFEGGSGGSGSPGGAGLGPGGGGGGIPAVPPSTPGIAAGGGGFLSNGGGSLGGTSYGTPTLLPLIGGSGGGGGSAPQDVTGGGGGGGGGAVVVASSTTITFNGTINANGGGAGASAFGGNPGSGGSGGAARLVATTIAGTGTILVNPGTGGGTNTGSPGRMRIEAYNNNLTLNGSQGASLSVGQPTVTALTGVTLQITSIGGISTPATPTGSYTNPDVLLPSASPAAVPVTLAATNIPLGTVISLTSTPMRGTGSSTISSGLAGTVASSTANGTLTISTTQPNVITASASFTLTADAVGGPIYAEGEPVERMRVDATWGGFSRVTYITRTGREVVAVAR